MKKLGMALALVLGLCGSVGLVDAGNNEIASEKKICEIENCENSEAHTHEVCQVAGCNETGNHEHDGMIYHGHSTEDGHAYHKCGVAGCTKTGEHSHNNSNDRNGHHGGHH